MASEMMFLNRHARTLKRASGGHDSLPCSSHDRPVLRNDLMLDLILDLILPDYCKLRQGASTCARER